MRAYVVHESAVQAQRQEGDTALTRVTFDRAAGCPRLEQRVIEVGRGRSRPRSPGDRQEALYVVWGRGALRLDGRQEPLQAGTALLLPPHAAYDMETHTGLKLVSVLAPVAGETPRRYAVARFADRPEERADENRSFRVLLETDVTVFLGLVRPSRAPDHSHPYDEVGYIVEGRGLAHVGGASIPIEPGSCFHLPPEEVHCIENAGPGMMTILGVFHPSGSPASRSYEAVR